MAVSSPLSVLPYRDSHSPFVQSDSMLTRGSSTSENVKSAFPDKSNASNTAGETQKRHEQQEIGFGDLSSNEGVSSNHEAQPVQASLEPEPRQGISPYLGLKIQTSQMDRAGPVARSDEDEPPQSVIHAPAGFGEFSRLGQTAEESCEDQNSPSTTEPKQSHPVDTLEVALKIFLIVRLLGHKQCKNLKNPGDARAQVVWKPKDIPEGSEFRSYLAMNPSMGSDTPQGQFGINGVEINALRTALTECWTLCNTLSNLSYINRGRPQDGMQDDAWRSCWRLCQKLYDTRDDEYWSQVVPTLDLCRDFCQALFEVRVCDSESTDSVLRVSFELNNHLYNTHDRNLPDAFRERTLDFYITLCHRLMKQRTRLTETDSLLSACWALAEMLFSIRQAKREGREPDEELLGSAVQACWELCDIFREGWTLHSMRSSDRGTPRPSQATFAQAFQQVSQQSEIDYSDDSLVQTPNPETPTTIFDDTATASPDEASVPNILVLGHGSGHTPPHSKWPSSVSNVSEKSRSSGQTVSSANTVTTTSENPHFTRLKVLITKAAINSGYQRGASQPLSSFVKSLPSDAFGAAPWQLSLLKNYRKLVVYDPAFRSAGFHARVSAVDVAHACQTMTQNGQYSWLRDLYRLVFGFHLEEALSRKGVVIQT
ncbi:hypothetical protein POX_b02139 [Penicillium oxalicum]|uniref:hypothetical protein n=1 Tax=Penicillium oxalicum TaxID=69781 RepID=UPI0020B79A6B|nr:hypothetical protein POX_b02139 [Penicillium oxalicum]KAI2792103.1 hypothetical protein POX_b02139 [Penicillium oxalicum]